MATCYQDFATLRAMLLEGELHFDPTTSEASASFWQQVNEKPPSNADVGASYFPLAFAATLPGKQGSHLTVTVESEDAFPFFAISSDDRHAQERLTKELIRLAQEAKDGDLPMMSVFSGLQDLSEDIGIGGPPTSTETPEPSASGTSSGIAGSRTVQAPLQIKTALLWAHHLLANSKRKDISHFSAELRVWAIDKVGYPGVMVLQGLEGDVNEFMRRLKAMQWYALQVRCEETVTATSTEDEQVLRHECTLANAIGASSGDTSQGRLKCIAKEVDSMSDLAALMQAANLTEVFATSMKLPTPSR